MSARTDDKRHHQMSSNKFGGLQRLRSAYHDEHLKAETEAWLEMDSDIDYFSGIHFDSDSGSDSD